MYGANGSGSCTVQYIFVAAVAPESTVRGRSIGATMPSNSHSNPHVTRHMSTQASSKAKLREAALDYHEFPT
ncbi:hypothetical protein CA830_35920, partial [Burkholderia multivorans]